MAIIRRPRPSQRRPPRRPADPFAPLSEQTIRARATADARAQVNPILAQIRGQIEGQARAGGERIRGYTSALADSLGGYQGKAAGIYGGAQQSQAAVENALASRLSGEGDRLSAELAGKLGQIGAPSGQVSEVAGGAGQMGQGLAGASFGRGSASLSRLISEGAAEQTLAAKQPGIARTGGLRQLATLERESQQQLADRTGDITSQLPNLIQQLLGDYRATELDKAGMREDRRRADRDFAFDRRVYQEGVLGKTMEAQQQAAIAADRSAQGWERIRQAGDRLRLQASNSSFNQALGAARVDLSEKNYKIALQREQRLAKPSKKGGFTPKQKQDLSATAFDTAADDFEAGARPVETLRDLIAAGVPFSLAIRAIQRFGKSEGADDYWRATLGWTKK